MDNNIILLQRFTYITVIMNARICYAMYNNGIYITLPIYINIIIVKYNNKTEFNFFG